MICRNEGLASVVGKQSQGRTAEKEALIIWAFKSSNECKSITIFFRTVYEQTFPSIYQASV